MTGQSHLDWFQKCDRLARPWNPWMIQSAFILVLHLRPASTIFDDSRNRASLPFLSSELPSAPRLLTEAANGLMFTLSFAISSLPPAGARRRRVAIGGHGLALGLSNTRHADHRIQVEETANVCHFNFIHATQMGSLPQNRCSKFVEYTQYVL